jgi:hypothetical protein
MVGFKERTDTGVGMRFIVTDQKELLGHCSHLQTKKFNGWTIYHDGEVEVYNGGDHIVLYAGYGIEQPLWMNIPDFDSLRDFNGNFFAVKIGWDEVQVQLDYFNNHKIFHADKYFREWSNHLPWMTKTEEDIVRTWLPYESLLQREFSEEETKTFFGHIHSILNDYDYIQDSKDAYNTKTRTDPDKLVEYIHKCMTEHSNVIKSCYKNRFISLSDGIDSALQSQYFRDDPQYMYSLSECDAGDDGKKYKKLVEQDYPHVKHEVIDMSRLREYTFKYLKDSATRWASFLPTMKQIADHYDKPDIVMYGANGDEMFFRDLIPHMQMLALEYWNEDYNVTLHSVLHDLTKKKNQYGATYTLGETPSFENYVDDFIRGWLSKDRTQDISEEIMLKWTTPKMYTRVYSQNNDVLTASLYNDRRIYHEVLKLPKEYLMKFAMDTPIQKKILKDKFEYVLQTPHKDALYADYKGIFENIYDATMPQCMSKNV